MIRTMQLILMLVVASVCTAARAAHNIATPYYAPQSAVVVDGDLGEWDGDYWIELDTVLSGSVEDVVSARYAVRWSQAANLLYVAVEVVDTDHRFAPRRTWERRDAVEISLDAGDHDTAFGPRMGYGQHIIIDGAGLWIATAGPYTVGEDLVIEWAAGLTDDQTLTYEVAIIPYAFYAGWGAVDTLGRMDGDDSVEVALADWAWIGLDVVVASNSRMGFGRLANNAVADKATQGDSLQTWVLVQATHDGLRPGDASGDGIVDDNDVLLLKSNFGMTDGAEWWRGDFDADGDVDLDDYGILTQSMEPPPRRVWPTPPPTPIDPEPVYDFSRWTFPGRSLGDVDRASFGDGRGFDVDRSEFEGRRFEVDRGF